MANKTNLFSDVATRQICKCELRLFNSYFCKNVAYTTYSP